LLVDERVLICTNDYGFESTGGLKITTQRIRNTSKNHGTSISTVIHAFRLSMDCPPHASLSFLSVSSLYMVITGFGNFNGNSRKVFSSLLFLAGIIYTPEYIKTNNTVRSIVSGR
jgi:hypothetical protein